MKTLFLVGVGVAGYIYRNNMLSFRKNKAQGNPKCTTRILVEIRCPKSLDTLEVALGISELGARI